jgi:hypothetical protein
MDLTVALLLLGIAALQLQPAAAAKVVMLAVPTAQPAPPTPAAAGSSPWAAAACLECWGAAERMQQGSMPSEVERAAAAQPGASRAAGLQLGSAGGAARGLGSRMSCGRAGGACG